MVAVDEFAAFGPQVEHFFTSLGHRISVTGLISVGLALLFLIAYGVLWLVGRSDGPSLAAVLEPYQLTSASGQGVAEPPPVLNLPFLGKLAAKAQSPLTGTRFGRWVDDMLDRAGSRLRVGELFTLWGGAAIVLVVLGWFLAGLVGMLIVLCLSIIIPIAALQAFVDHRAKLFASQLPDVLKLTSSSLRAGFSLLQGLDSVIRQMQEPSKGELQRVLAEARLGAPSRTPWRRPRRASATVTSARAWLPCVSSRRAEATWRRSSTLLPRQWCSASGCGARSVR